MAVPLTYRLLAEFSAVFDEAPKTLDDYLKGINRETFLNAVAFLLGFSNRNSEYDSHHALLSMFFNADNNELANQINDRLNVLQKEYGSSPLIVNPLTALQLFEYGFDHLNDESTQSKSETEVNIFKAILAQNEANTKAQQLGYDSTEALEMPGKLHAMTFATSLPSSELVNYDLYEVAATQLIKSIYLFEFLASNERTQSLLRAFLLKFNVDTWQAFLKKLIPLMFSVLKKDREAHTDIVVADDANFTESTAFIEQLIAQDNELLEDFDFRQIRGTPFYKAGKGVYRVIFDLFVAELLHKGLYFKLNEVNKTLPKGEQIKNFRSFYTDEFSERYLLYGILESIYEKRYVKFTGSQMKASGIDAEPDYYIRNGNKMFLYESKDILINAEEVKTNYDFKVQEAEFRKKLYYEDKDGKRANKAVMQLVLNIDRALTLQFPFDKNYKPTNLYIYPIVILHDHMYNVPGLNYLVNQWYLDEVEKLRARGLPTQRLRPLTIIDMDTLIYYQDILRDQGIRLEGAIDAYHNFVAIDSKKKYRSFEDAKAAYQGKTIGFATFLAGFVKNKGFKPPKMIREKGISLFDQANDEAI